MLETDVLIIGGGVLGTAIGYGLARQDARCLLIDAALPQQRASVGNFGLIWVQGKGLHNRPYARWSLQAANRYPEFVDLLYRQTAIDCQYQRPGGLVLVYNRQEFEDRTRVMQELIEEAGTEGYACEMMTPPQIQGLIPRLQLGSAVAGGSFSPNDGHINPLFLLRALRAGMLQQGGRIIPGCPALKIDPRRDGFEVRTPRGTIRAQKVVLSAGNGIPELARDLNLQVPVRPQKGQLLVTEKAGPLLPLPLSGIRQTGEGSFLLGYSQEEVGFDSTTTLKELKRIANRARATFPQLGRLRIVRTWAAHRVLTPDLAPIYQESTDFPGAFVATSHSGVTLAPLHAGPVAHWIHTGERPRETDTFDLRRFDVQATP